MPKYDSIVYEYFSNLKSTAILVSDDILFHKTLRATLNKTLSIKRECLSTFGEPTRAGKQLRDRCEKNYPTMLFVESMLRGRKSRDFIVASKTAYPGVKIIALVSETRREDIAYLYEIGCDNVIAKPASVNNIIEKMAFTIQPQGKLTGYVHGAKTFLARKEYEKTLKVVDKILEIKPGSPTGLMLRGDAMLGMGKRERALEAYMEAHKGAELYIEPLKRLANFFHGHDDQKYLKFLKKLDKLSPLITERKTEIGKTHFTMGEVKKAEKYFDQAIECAQIEASGLIEGVAESIATTVAAKSPELSEKYLQAMLEAKGDRLSRDDIGTFNRLGIALKHQGKWREAIDNYRKALSIAPDDEALHYNMGMAHFEGGSMKDAATCLQKALDINPLFYKKNLAVTVNVATVFFRGRKFKTAREFLDHALELNPNHAKAKEMMGVVVKATNNPGPNAKSVKKIKF